MDGVFAGGKGRIASECADYKTLGGIYGNTCLIIDRPVIHYPYWDDKKKQYLSPSDDANMAHPADDNNRDVYSFSWSASTVAVRTAPSTATLS